jgi:hypothetical protein
VPKARGLKNPPNHTVPEIISPEQAMYLERVSGQSIKDIAHMFGRSPEAVQAIIDMQCPLVTTDLKIRTIGLELSRLDELHATFHPKAKAGDDRAAAIVLRIQERRAQMLGIDSPMRIDAVQVRAEAVPQPSGVDRIMEALNRLAGKPETGELH